MSNSKTSQGESDKKRNLPSWMSSGENRKKPTNSIEIEEGIGSEKSKGPDSSLKNFSKLMEGVVFVLSGFVNAERATLRSQALEMGADYRQDWDEGCTLLVCAYSNTPKFRKLRATMEPLLRSLLPQEWISDCYSQKKLVEIDTYLMRAGKPWRKSSSAIENSCEQKPSPPKSSPKQVERRPRTEKTTPSSSKSRASNPVKVHFSPSKVKEWAADDLNRTISWLESQEEKPEPSEINEIAAGGIIICLQDAIDSIEQDMDIRKIADQWNIVPQAVEELIKLVDAGKSSKEDLCKQFKECIQTYEAELNKVRNDSNLKKRRLKSDESEKGSYRRADTLPSDAADYESDETVEMTEEEIDLAYNNIASLRFTSDK